MAGTNEVPVPPAAAVVLKTFTQADVDAARREGHLSGYEAGLDVISDREWEIRRGVKLIVDNLRAGIFTELRAIQELEALIGP